MFPYNYISFNLTSRQLIEAENYETDFWGLSLKEAAASDLGRDRSMGIIGNPAHLVQPYLPRGALPMLDPSQLRELPPKSEVIFISYTRSQKVPIGCLNPQFVTRQLPAGGQLLKLSFAVRCVVNQ